MMRLSSWTIQSSKETYDVVENAAMCISFIESNGHESAPYDVIGLFLSHVVLWAIAKVANISLKSDIVERLKVQPNLSSEVCEFIDAGFVDRSPGYSAAEPELILKHAIQSLVQNGTWGASSNLALLLHHTSVAK
jgi:hypothetical protein